MIKINEIKLNIFEDDFKNKILSKISSILKLDKNNLDEKSLKILRRSIDARFNKIFYVYNVAINLKNVNVDKILNKHKNISKYNENEYIVKQISNNNIINDDNRPVVIGFGPAGIFCSYVLAKANLKPIILERGKSIEDRIKDVDSFINKGILNEESNISFGEGGAGTFSDGKLYTRNFDKDGLNYFILKTFIENGADENILYDSNAHIGTDKLQQIIINIRNKIIELGGEIKFNYKWTFDDYYSINYKGPKVLAIGNSSRDTFLDLYNNHFNIESKPIAIGYRVIHEQNLIDYNQYNTTYEKIIKKLGPANYKLLTKFDNKSIYSFCMCPGGFVLNSTNYNKKNVTNGMSFHNRDNKYANSAIVITIDKNDLLNNEDPLCLLKLQDIIENEVYKLTKNNICYCYLSDFKNDNIADNKKIIPEKINKMFYGKYEYNTNLTKVLNMFQFDFNKIFINAMNNFNKVINGFSDDNVVVAGIETRTSSPVKIDRNENLQCNIKNFYPSGEGLGHGGGIMSCAIDGIKIAEKIVKEYENNGY